jgi:hypothetical protein
MNTAAITRKQKRRPKDFYPTPAQSKPGSAEGGACPRTVLECCVGNEVIAR